MCSPLEAWFLFFFLIISQGRLDGVSARYLLYIYYISIRRVNLYFLQKQIMKIFFHILCIFCVLRWVFLGNSSGFPVLWFCGLFSRCTSSSRICTNSRRTGTKSSRNFAPKREKGRGRRCSSSPSLIRSRPFFSSVRPDGCGGCAWCRATGDSSAASRQCRRAGCLP